MSSKDSIEQPEETPEGTPEGASPEATSAEGPPPLPEGFCEEGEANAELDAAAQEPLSPEAQREKELADAHAAVEEQKDLALRAHAELQNYKKQVTRQLDQAKAYGKRDVVRALIPSFDNFKHALAMVPDDDQSMLAIGLRMVITEIDQRLNEVGVKVIDPTDESFDPSKHEVVERKADEEVPAGRILSVQARGYLMGELLVRPAKVIVSAGPEVEEAAPSEEDVATSDQAEAEDADSDADASSPDSKTQED